MRNATISGSLVKFFRGNKHRSYIPVWYADYGTESRAKRAKREWEKRARFMRETPKTKH